MILNMFLPLPSRPLFHQPYEQVGNSIGYQLLHQGHRDVTSTLIDSLYPALKVSTLYGNISTRVEFWHRFCDYNYLSLNRQLTPITITNVAYE